MASRYRVLVIGVGSIGERHVRCFQATDRTDVSICEPNDTLRAKVTNEYSISQSYSNFDAALSDHRPECAVIATPAASHVPIAIKLAEAGVHLLIEKPLSTTTDSIHTLASAQVKSDLTIVVAYVFRCHPALAAMRSAIESGRFGKPVQIVGVAGQNFPTYRPAYFQTYYSDRGAGGGAVQDALTHMMNASEWLVGPVTRVVADFDHLVLPRVSVEDTVNVISRHGGVLGSYSLNQHQSPDEWTITVICTEGTARFEYHQAKWRWMTEKGGAWSDEAAPIPDRDTLFVRQANLFLDAVEKKSQPSCSLNDGLQSLRVNLAILASTEQGKWINVG
jgi:predicted dehydrogenase